ncbi:TrbC/VirB2 family protein [Candidatus Uhrbacteria bacterium]|nr:TrbC/VirB2 family protein [Candidatus Uhrbacteria bacterium]
MNLELLRKKKIPCFFILHSSFLIFFLFSILHSPFSIQTASAAEVQRPTNIRISPTCFTKSECEAVPYKGTPSPQAVPECQNASFYHSQEAINRGIIYNCYAKHPPVKLQVSIGGRTVTGLENYIQRLYNYLLGIVGIVAGIMIVWAGVKWLTAGPLPERIEDAKKKIAGAIMGLVIALASYVILQTVNPALVNLRLPPVKLARQSQEVTEVVCRDIPQFHCGGRSTERRYRVDNETIPAAFAEFLSEFGLDTLERGSYGCNNSAYSEHNPCGSAGGVCKGIYCQQGDCFDIRMVRVLAPALEKIRTLEGGMANLKDPIRGCFSPAECSSCEGVQITETDNRLTSEGRYNLQLCASAACNCLVSLDAPGNLTCVSRKAEGQNCRVTEECSEGLQCMPTNRSLEYENFKCTRPPVGLDEFCLNDSQCTSGICEHSGATTPDNRIHIGICRTGAQGQPCVGGASGRCAPGLICIDTWGPGGTCSDRAPGRPCQCPADCRSGACEGGADPRRCLGRAVGIDLAVSVGTCR